MITDLEPDLRFVFQRIGQPETTAHIEKFVEFVHSHKEGVEYTAAYRHVYALFPSLREFEDVVAGCVKAGYISIKSEGNGAKVYPGKTGVVKAAQRDANGRRTNSAPLS